MILCAGCHEYFFLGQVKKGFCPTCYNSFYRIGYPIGEEGICKECKESYHIVRQGNGLCLDCAITLGVKDYTEEKEGSL